MPKKMGQIEFLRLLFMLLILYGHLMQHFIFPHFGDMPIFVELRKHTSFAFGYLCEAFFTISGFFLAQALSSEKYADFRGFAISRIARLAPVVWLVMLFHAIYQSIGWGQFIFFGNLTALFFIPNALSMRIPSQLDWFVGSLFWASVLYYLVWKVVDRKKFYYLVGIITLCVYCILLNKQDLYSNPPVWGGIFPFFLLRGIGGIGLGILFGGYFLNKNTEEVTSGKKIFWSALDLTLILTLIYLSVIKRFSYSFPAMMTCFVILFYSFLFKSSYITKFVSCKFFVWAAKYSYSVYITQFAVFILLYNTLYMHPVWGVRQYPVGNIVFSLCAVYLVSIAVYHLVESPLRKLILVKFSGR